MIACCNNNRFIVITFFIEISVFMNNWYVHIKYRWNFSYAEFIQKEIRSTYKIDILIKMIQITANCVHIIENSVLKITYKITCTISFYKN